MKIIFALIVALYSQVSAASNIPDFPFILVNGTASIDVKPDRAKISFKILEFNKSAEVATSALSLRGKEVVELASKNGVTKNLITSSTISKSTKRAQDSNYNTLEILGYELEQTFTIEIENIKTYSLLADKLNSMQNIQTIESEFDVSNREEIASGLVKVACANAKKKATSLASGLDVIIGNPFAVTQDSNFTALTNALGISEETELRSLHLAFTTEPSSNMFIPKTINISSYVTVIYKIN